MEEKMILIIGVRFRKSGKVYYFAPNGLDIKKGDHVIVETARGIEYGLVVLGQKEVTDDKVVQPLKDVIRIATESDYEIHAENEEKEKEALEALEEQVEKEEAKEVQPLSLNKNINVLVLCVGAGTSAMFANAVKEGAEIENLPIDATASAYGSHYDILKDYDIVVLSPQVQSHLEEVQQDASKYGTKVVATKGAQYIKLTRDPKGAVEFICEQVKEG